MSKKCVTFTLDPLKHGHQGFAADGGEGGRNGVPSTGSSGGIPVLPRPLTIDEKRYLLAVERGDLTTVRKMLGRAEAVGLDPNCVDALGRGALALAIDAENLAMVQLLVVLGVRTGDALLHAVDAGFVEASQLLLEHEELVHKPDKPYSWECVDWTTSRYTPDMTPLVLAAHRDNYEILKMLLDRGATLPMPHDLRCGCTVCVSEEEADSLRRSVTRLNEYRALASPSLLALSSGDPLLAAFQLSWELRGLASAEPECRSEYLELRKQCQKFAVDLLQQARSSTELAIILNHDPDNPPYEEGDTMTLARLQLAILYKQKKFVAHPYVQQLLSSLWYAGLPGFRRQPALLRAFAVIRVVVTAPLLCLMYAVSPSCGPARLLKQPFVKFLVHASCYLFFLCILNGFAETNEVLYDTVLLILVSQRAELQIRLLFADEVTKEDILQEERYQRGNPPSPLEWVVLVYVIGFIWEETSEMFHLGLHRYLRNLWNFIDFLRNSLYVLGAVVRAVAYFQQRQEIRLDPAAAVIPRELWDNFDPQLVADGLFAAANIFSALKLVHLFSINPHLGPLQISLGRMVNDIVKFLFIYSLVLFSFACGMNQLLWYFADLERQKCYSLPDGKPDWENNSDSCTKWRRFSSLFEASQSLFWASFGNVGIDNFQLEGIKSYTRFWGLLMFGSYSVINIIVLLNLLIAMMSTSYAMIESNAFYITALPTADVLNSTQTGRLFCTEVPTYLLQALCKANFITLRSFLQERADTEWKFARTKLWLSYFEDGSTLPPPFNILPTPKRILRFIRCGKGRKSRRSATKPLGVTPKPEGMDSHDQDVHIWRRYDAMMRALVWRYVSAAQRAHELAPATEDAVGELRSDLSSLRCRLLDVFAKNGMDVSAEPVDPGGEPPAGKRMRGWERRLLKDFAVTPQPAGSAGAQLLMGPPPPGEKPLDRFRRAARLVVLRGSTQHWRRAIRGVCYQSQIGRSHPGRGRESLTKLQRAMAEAQRLAVQVEMNVRTASPITPFDAAAPASAAAASNVLQLLRASSLYADLDYGADYESISLSPLLVRAPETRPEITIDESTPLEALRARTQTEPEMSLKVPVEVESQSKTPPKSPDPITQSPQTTLKQTEPKEDIRIDITEDNEDDSSNESAPASPKPAREGASSPLSKLMPRIYKRKAESPAKPRAPSPPMTKLSPPSPKTGYNPTRQSPSPRPSPQASPIRRSPSPRTGWF